MFSAVWFLERGDGLEVGAPEAVEVAVGVGGNGCAAGGGGAARGWGAAVHGEDSLGSIRSCEVADVDAVSGDEHDELNVVRIGHGVRLTTNAHAGALFVAGHYGEVLLRAGFSGVGFEHFHLLITADGGYAARKQHEDEIAANGAIIKCNLHNDKN